MQDDEHLDERPSDDASDVAGAHASGGDTVDEPAGEVDATGAALGVLSPEEAAAVLAAAENDPAIAKDLAELQAVVAELARLGPSASVNRGRSAGIRSRLMSRAEASGGARPAPRQGAPHASLTPSRPFLAAERTPPPSPTPPRGIPERRLTPRASTERRTTPEAVPPVVERRGRFWKRTLGTLAVAAVFLTAAGIFELWRERDSRGVSEAAIVATSNIATHDSLYRTVLDLRDAVAKRDSMIAMLRNPHTRVIDLAGNAPATLAGRAFWDQTRQRLMLSMDGLPQPDSGRTYQLWVMARGRAQPVAAGTFMPDSAGHAQMVSDVAVDAGELRRVAITEEPMGGSSAPTGAVLFAGQ